MLVAETFMPASDWLAVYWDEDKDGQITLIFSRLVFFEIMVEEACETDTAVYGYDAFEGRINEPCESAGNHLGYIHQMDRHDPEKLSAFRKQAEKRRALEMGGRNDHHHS